MFDNFFGNKPTADALEEMIDRQRIPQTLLFSGREGVGKATLTRRFAARLLGGQKRIEQDDLSLPHNVELIAQRATWTSEKRSEEPLVFASHPDFVTFAPDGPLHQISIQQMRWLKERAQFAPLHGKRRIFLVDHIDRANEQAANSLLKILEEPPEHLILVLTAENAYDLLPTIRSRAVPLHFVPLTTEQMQQFMASRELESAERRMALADGSPGVATSVDLDAYDARRAAMFALLQVAAGASPFEAWLKHAETVARSRQEKLEAYLKVLYVLLEDLLNLQQQIEQVRNPDLREELAALASRVSVEWIDTAVKKLDELTGLLRRNIQKSIALDALILELRTA